MAGKTGRPEHSTGQSQTVSDKQFKRILKALDLDSNPIQRERNKSIMEISFKLGLRVKEIASLNIGDVLDSKGSIRTLLRLISDKTKGRKHRDLPLGNEKLRKQLRIHLDLIDTSKADVPLFTTQRGNRFSPNSLQQAMKRMFVNGGLDGKYSSHSGRRTFITKLSEKGFDIYTIKEAAGHSSIQTTQRYIERNEKRIFEMLKCL